MCVPGSSSFVFCVLFFGQNAPVLPQRLFPSPCTPTSDPHSDTHYCIIMMPDYNKMVAASSPTTPSSIIGTHLFKIFDTELNNLLQLETVSCLTSFWGNYTLRHNDRQVIASFKGSGLSTVFKANIRFSKVFGGFLECNESTLTGGGLCFSSSDLRKRVVRRLRPYM